MSVRERAIGNVTVQWIEKACVVALRLGGFVVIVRALSTAALGKYSLVTGLATLFIFLTDLGLDDTLVKIMATRPSRTSTLLADLVGVKIVLAVLSTALMMATVVVLGYDAELVRLAAVASSAILFGALAAVASDYFRVSLRMQYVALANVVSSAFFLAAVVWTAARGGDVVGFIAAWSAATLVNLVVLAAFFVRFKALRKARFDFGGWRGIALMALPLGLASLLSNVYTSVDVVILSRLAGFEAAGVYSAAYRFVFVGVMFPYAFVNTLYPLMASYWSVDKRRAAVLFQQAFDYMLVFAFSVTVSLVLLAPKLMTALSDTPEYEAGAIALQLLGVALGVMFVSILASFALVAADKQRANLTFGTIGVVVNVSLNVLFVPKYGYTAAAAVTIITEMAVLVPAMWLAQRTIEARVSLRILPKAVVVGAACGAVLYLTQAQALWVQLVLLVAVFSAVVLSTGTIRPNEFLSVLRSSRHDTETWPLGETP